FGGTYSMKFPEISGQLMDNKLKHIAETGAERLVVDCPGCVMQIKGGAEKKGQKIKVQHIAELLAENLKKD
ncbi:MAG: (Fe-S)-binding protein, partial [Desulfovibrio sp.]|nr:(Fe-S)-binding protein [Desulfovibrio sp.]